jgi:hypothetical protein
VEKIGGIMPITPCKEKLDWRRYFSRKFLSQIAVGAIFAVKLLNTCIPEIAWGCIVGLLADFGIYVWGNVKDEKQGMI